MQAYWTLFRRELTGYFLSFTGYSIIAAAALATGGTFWVLLDTLQQNPTPMPVTELFFTTFYFGLIPVLTAPAITMRLFAQERFSGTFETLMTAPVSELQVVMAKFTAAFLFYLVTWLPLLACLWLVRYFTNDPAAFDAGAVGTTYLGIALLGGVFVSLGCCASALTRTQALAAMISLLVGAGLLVLAQLAAQMPASSGWQAQAISSFALGQQMQDFARGVVDSRPVVLYLTLTFFFLFLTVRTVESRRWR